MPYQYVSFVKITDFFHIRQSNFSFIQIESRRIYCSNLNTIILYNRIPHHYLVFFSIHVESCPNVVRSRSRCSSVDWKLKRMGVGVPSWDEVVQKLQIAIGRCRQFECPKIDVGGPHYRCRKPRLSLQQVDGRRALRCRANNWPS